MTPEVVCPAITSTVGIEQRRVQVVRAHGPLRRADRVADRSDREGGRVRRDDRLRRSSEGVPEHRGLQGEILGQRLHEQIRALRSRVDLGRHPDPVARCGDHGRLAQPFALDECEPRIGASARSFGVARVQQHVVPGEGVLAPDLRAHQSGTDDRHAHGP